MARKLLIGLLQLDVCAGIGEPVMQHRYCCEVVRPLLRAVATDTRLRFAISAPGLALEFLAEHYPAETELLRQLIGRKQIELVSALYAPAAWPLFPGRDLLRSIQLNRSTLERLGLTAAPVFYADDGFFGPGIELIRGEFEFALCKDTYFSGQCLEPWLGPLREVGGAPVLVGANNVLAEIARDMIETAQLGALPLLSLFHRARIDEAVRSVSPSSSIAIAGTHGELHWRWVHFGGAHHFASRAAPMDWEGLFCDPAWLRLTLGTAAKRLDEGYQAATPTEFVRELGLCGVEPEAVDPIIESGWDPVATAGMNSWAGRQNRWQSTSGLLSLVWRARSALRAAEEAKLAGRPDDFEQAWRHQIAAECGRALDGTQAGPAAGFARQHAEAVLRLCSEPSIQAQVSSPVSSSVDTPWAEAEIIGADGALLWSQVEEQVQACELRFRQEEGMCGIRFRRQPGPICYCPSGSEHRPARVDLKRLRLPCVHLPIANGLIGLADESYLIRINQNCPIAAAVRREDEWITFAVEGGMEGRLIEWKFLLVKGNAEAALRYANVVNSAV